MQQDLSEWWSELARVAPDATGSKLVTTALIAVALWVARWALLRLVRGQTKDVKVRYRWRKYTAYVAALVGLLLIGRVWFEALGSVVTFLGLLSAGVAVALRDIIVNSAGWLFIISRRPFSVGDRVQVGDHAGDVIDLRVFQFTLLEIGNWVEADQSTGRVIHVPNGNIFREPLANYTRGLEYIWNEIPVLVTFESDWRKAKEILLRVVEEHGGKLSEDAESRVLQASRRFMIFYSTLTPTVYTAVRASGVLLTIRYLTKPRRRRGTEQAIWEDILDEFGRADDIDFAYPTQRFYDNAVEGKAGARAVDPGGGAVRRP